MRTLTSLTIAVVLLAVPTTLAAQDEAPTITVVPDSQFCMLVTPDDTPACEEALATMASAGLVPEAFGGLMTAAPPAEADAAAVTGEPVKVAGKGSKNTKPFSLAEGDYEITLRKAKGCDEYTYASLQHTDGGSAGGGLIEQDGFVYGIEEGRYYWDATADNKCKWTYTLTPLE